MLETQTGGSLPVCDSWSRARMGEAKGFMVVPC